MTKADIARDYRRRYGKDMKTATLAGIMHEENKKIFKTKDIARYALRSIEGKGSKSYKVLPEFEMKEDRPKGNTKVKSAAIPDSPNKDIHIKIKDLFSRSNSNSIEDISNRLDIGIKRVSTCISELVALGHNFKIKDNTVLFSNEIERPKDTYLDVHKMSTGFHKFGAIGDNHMGSKYERMDVLNAMYDMYEREGVTVVYNTGNWIDGEARFNIHDLHKHGMGNQIDYFIEKYPKRKGITTYFIGGDDHEGWYVQREGVDIGKFAEYKAREAGRTDLVYLGYMEADVIIKAKNGQTKIRLLHPGGGSAYATSYTVQKIVESYQGGEKPDVLLVGHYHKADYLFCRGVHCVQTGTTQDQSPFMRKKKLAAHLGGWIIEMATDNNGAITRFKQEFFPFYDNAYYKKWEYKWK